MIFFHLMSLFIPEVGWYFRTKSVYFSLFVQPYNVISRQLNGKVNRSRVIGSIKQNSLLAQLTQSWNEKEWLFCSTTYYVQMDCMISFRSNCWKQNISDFQSFFIRYTFSFKKHKHFKLQLSAQENQLFKHRRVK